MSASMMSIQQAKAWLAQGGVAAELVGDAQVTIDRVHTDTRTLKSGDLFVALNGERFDAHDFLPVVRQSGALAAIAQHGLVGAGLSGLQVADTKLALGKLSSGWRSQFDLPLIAVTGSNGKTTVTQMVAAILRAWKKDAAFATQGNLNNDIGVPLTLLRLQHMHQAAVVELGMNHSGEIGYLAALCQPTVALVNNAQREHLEFMETVEAVARENGSVINALPLSGTAVFPADEVFTPLWKELAGDRTVLTFAAPGTGRAAADVTGHAEWHGDAWRVQVSTPLGDANFSLGIAGLHNVKNAFAAAACAVAAGAPLACIAQGLACFVAVKGRSRAVKLVLPSGPISLVDDTYNANPDSMQAAVDVLASLPGPRLLVMGDMGEVGDEGPRFHAEAGRYAQDKGIDKLFTFGPLSRLAAGSFNADSQHFDSIEALNAGVRNELPRLASVLVKGSRFMAMERVVQALVAAAQPLDNDNNKGQHHAA